MFCPKCGSENSAQSRFCRNCGFDIKSITVETPGQPIIPPAPSAELPATPVQPPVTPGVVPPVAVPSPTSPVPLPPPSTAMPIWPVYAGFWLRFVAALIDGLIISTVTFPFSFIFGLFNGFDQRAADFGSNIGLVLSFIGLVLFINAVFIIIEWLYYALMESSSKQGTLGKMALGLKVTDLNGNRISFGRATGRYFGRILSGMIFNIGFLMIAFTAKKQGLHDIIAGTLVVKK